jgi:hypothetical protein
MIRRMKWQGLALAGLMLVATALLQAQPSEGMIQKHLDTPVTIDVKNRPIGEVFWKLTQQSKLRFRVHEDTLAALPYGEQTHMDLHVSGATLREALPQILHPHGLTWRLEDGVVQIVPHETLYRMNRRATFDEIQLLGQLLTTRLSASGGDVEPVSLLREACGDGDLALVLPDGLLGEGLDVARRRADQVSPASPAAWLDMLCGEGYTWYLSGDRLTVLPREDQVRRQLQRRISLRYEHARLVTVLLDLARAGDVQLSLSPGALTALPADTRGDFTLMIEEASIAQALEVISGATGLEFSVTAEGIEARPALTLTAGSLSSQAARAQGDASRPRRPAGLILQTSFTGSDGQVRELLVPMFDLPEDVREEIQRRQAKAIAEMQKHWVLPPAAEESAVEDTAVPPLDPRADVPTQR